MSYSKRTARFLQDAVERVKNNPVFNRCASWQRGFELYEKEPWKKRLALTNVYVLEHEPLHVFENERITGMIYYGHRGIPEYELTCREFWRHMENDDPDFFRLFGMTGASPQVVLDEAAIWSGTGFSPAHIGWHWDWIVAEGIEGILYRIEDRLSESDAQGREILECMKISLNGMLHWAESHLEVLESLACGNRIWREERIETLSRVPRRGARNFREAVQAFHFAYMAGMLENPHGGNSPGRLDYYLGPYLERDLEQNLITRSEAREIVDELFIRFHERMLWKNDGAVETVVLGGVDQSGRCSAGVLTEIMIDSFIDLPGLTHPSLYLRMAPGQPEWVWRLGIRYLREGGNRAQLINDTAVVNAMTLDGDMPVADARNYMCGGCMELSSFGKNGDMLFTGFFNVAKVLEYVLTGGYCLQTGRKVWEDAGCALAGYACFEDLLKAFEEQLEKSLMMTFSGMDQWVSIYASYRPMFFISSLVEDCIGRGRTINDGGAVYEDFGSTPLGIPNAADSLTAIRIAVYEDKLIGPGELLEAIRDNFRKHESLRLRLRKLPKYGQGNAEADGMMRRLTEKVCAVYRRRKNALGGKYKPMIMTFMMAPVEGRKLGASADGRLAGEPIAHGIMPQISSVTAGIGQAMLSATAMPITHFSGGASHMWDIDPGLAASPHLRSLVETFFQLGGQMFQGNIMDAGTLKEAQEHPERYPALTVRVGGYSAIFANLSPDNRREIIERISALGKS